MVNISQTNLRNLKTVKTNTMNLLCDDCGRLFELPLFEPNGGEYGGLPTYDIVSPCCKGNFTEEKVVQTFTVSEDEYNALVGLAQYALGREANDLQFEEDALTRSLIKEQLIAKAKLAGLEATDWYKEFISDLETL